MEHSGLGEELLLILIVCHNRKCYFALCREIWRPPKPLGRHNHSCRDMVCFLPWCEWDLRTSEYFHLSRLVLCWGCPQMWRGKTDQQAKTWFISMLIGAKFLWSIRNIFAEMKGARPLLTDIIQDLWSTTLSLSHYQLGVYLAGTRKKVNYFLLHLKISLLNMALYLVQRSRSCYDKIIKKNPFKTEPNRCMRYCR